MSIVRKPVVLAATTAGAALSMIFQVFHIATRPSGVKTFDIFRMRFPAFDVLVVLILFYSICLFILKRTLNTTSSTVTVDALISKSKSTANPRSQSVLSRSGKRRYRRRNQQQLGLLSMLSHHKSENSERSHDDDDVLGDEEASSAASLLPFSLSLSTASITKLWEDLFLSPESAMKTPFRILKPEEEDELFFATDNTSFEDDSEYDDDISAGNNKTVHFCFLVHGFRGHSRDLSYVQAVMRRLASLQKSRRQLVVHSSRCNEKKTDDGVIAGGTRLFHEMLDVIRLEMASRTKNDADERNLILRPITISLWGNSLGGLYARYALSLLSEHFPASKDATDGTTCWILDNSYVAYLNIFCTTATPHLGISGHTFVALPRRAEIGLASAMGTTGQDLFRINSILYDMATSERFVNPLSLFRKRVCYANAYGTDFPVPASTAAFLSECSTYPHHVSDDMPDDDSLLQIATLYTVPANASSENASSYIQSKDDSTTSLDTELAQMSISLDSLGWKKVFVDMRKEVPHIVLPKSLIRGGSGSKGFFSSKTTSTLLQSMTASTGSERSSHGSHSSDEEYDDSGLLASTLSPTKLGFETSTFPIEPIHNMVKKRRISSRYNSASTGSNGDNSTMILSSKDVTAAVSASALLLDTGNTDNDTPSHDGNIPNDERDEMNDEKDITRCRQDETHFAIHWPLGHNMIVAFSRSRWSAHMNKAGRPVVDSLANEIVNDILAFPPKSLITTNQ